MEDVAPEYNFRHLKQLSPPSPLWNDALSPLLHIFKDGIAHLNDEEHRGSTTMSPQTTIIGETKLSSPPIKP